MASSRSGCGSDTCPGPSLPRGTVCASLKCQSVLLGLWTPAGVCPSPRYEQRPLMLLPHSTVGSGGKGAGDDKCPRLPGARLGQGGRTRHEMQIQVLGRARRGPRSTKARCGDDPGTSGILVTACHRVCQPSTTMSPAGVLQMQGFMCTDTTPNFGKSGPIIAGLRLKKKKKTRSHTLGVSCKRDVAV